MTCDELVKLIAEVQKLNSELENIEVKSANKGTPRHLHESFSAFANRSTGGVLLLGLDENRQFEIVGMVSYKILCNSA